MTANGDAKLWQAVNLALDESMQADERVVVLGQDVARPGGPYGLTRSLLDKYGPDRVRDAPISEAALVATGIGAAMMGLRPVVEVMFLDFVTLAMDQLVNQAAKYRTYTRQQATVPLVVHTLYGGRANMGGQHSQSLEAWLCHVPGLKVAFPSTPQDEYDVLRAAIQDPDPVVVVTPIAQLRSLGPLRRGTQPPSPPGTARLVRPGTEVTVVSYGPAVEVCRAGIEASGVDAELIDLCWLQPWDEAMVRGSVRRTNRLLVVHDAYEQGGWGAELVARIASEEFWHLDAPPRRIGGRAEVIPVAARDWEGLLPTRREVSATLLEMVR